MKRWILAVAVLLIIVGALPLFAVTTTVTQDVIRLSLAKVSDDSIILFVQAKRGEVEVSADDVIAMSQAGVSSAVITAIIDESATRREAAQRDDPPRVYYPYPYYSYPPYYGPSLHGFIGFGGYYGGYGHYGRGFGHYRGWSRGWRH